MDNGRIAFHDWMTSVLNRYWLFWHLAIFGFCLVLLLLPDYSFPLMQFIRFPLVLIQLLTARFFQSYDAPLVVLPMLLFLAIFLGFPQICLWTIRKRKYLICGLILAALILDIMAAFAHFQYCRWSTRQVGSFYKQSITVEQLYRDCGRPLCYKNAKNGTIAIYGDGMTAYWVELEDSGIIKQMPMGSLWMD